MLGISKTTYTYAIDPKDRFLAKYSHIKSSVENNRSYGTRRIKAALKQKYDITVGRDTLGKLLKLWGLDLKRKIRKNKPNMIRTILIALSDRCNLLIRSNMSQPLKALTSDISEFKFNNGKNKFFMCVHKDVLGQMVYGYSVDLNMRKELTIKSFLMAIKSIKHLCKEYKYKIDDKILMHQDQGSQYTSHSYVDTVLNHNFRLSYSTPGTPTENPGQESFFGRFKEEWKDEIFEIKTFKEIQEFVEDKIQYYTYDRIHTSIGYKSPFAYTKNFLENT